MYSLSKYKFWSAEEAKVNCTCPANPCGCYKYPEFPPGVSAMCLLVNHRREVWRMDRWVSCTRAVPMQMERDTSFPQQTSARRSQLGDSSPAWGSSGVSREGDVSA